MQINKKKIVYLVISVILLGLIVIGIKKCSSGNAFEYKFQKISKGDVNKTISVTGVLEVMNQERVLSKLSGMISQVHVDYNSLVRKGQLLAVMDTDNIDQRLYKTQTQLDSARLELEAAKKELEGKQKMFKDNLISKQSMDQAQIKYKSVFYNHKRTLIDYNQLAKQKNYTRIKSPINGIVISKHIDQKVPVGVNSLLFIIVPSLKTMQLIISIDESDIGNIKTGQNVFFFVSAFPNKKFTGSIKQVRINPVQSRGLVTYQALVICNNDGLILKPGMTATATIEVAKKKDVLRVPNQALLISPEEVDADDRNKYIWLKSSKIRNKPYKKIKVDTGLTGDMFTEIRTNLKPGKEVLVKIIEIKD